MKSVSAAFKPFDKAHSAVFFTAIPAAFTISFLGEMFLEKIMLSDASQKIRFLVWIRNNYKENHTCEKFFCVPLKILREKESCFLLVLHIRSSLALV